MDQEEIAKLKEMRAETRTLSAAWSDIGELIAKGNRLNSLSRKELQSIENEATRLTAAAKQARAKIDPELADSAPPWTPVFR